MHEVDPGPPTDIGGRQADECSALGVDVLHRAVNPHDEHNGHAHIGDEARGDVGHDALDFRLLLTLWQPFLTAASHYPYRHLSLSVNNVSAHSAERPNGAVNRS